MGRSLIVVSLLVAGCAAPQSSGGDSGDSGDSTVAKTARELCPESIPAPIPEEKGVAPWWNDKGAACPEGTMFKGTPPPFGDTHNTAFLIEPFSEGRARSPFEFSWAAPLAKKTARSTSAERGGRVAREGGPRHRRWRRRATGAR